MRSGQGQVAVDLECEGGQRDLTADVESKAVYVWMLRVRTDRGT